MMTYFYPGDVVQYRPNHVNASELTPGTNYHVEQVFLKMGGPEICKTLLMISGKYHDGKDFIVIKQNHE